MFSNFPSQPIASYSQSLSILRCTVYLTGPKNTDLFSRELLVHLIWPVPSHYFSLTGTPHASHSTTIDIHVRKRKKKKKKKVLFRKIVFKKVSPESTRIYTAHVVTCERRCVYIYKCTFSSL